MKDEGKTDGSSIYDIAIAALWFTRVCFDSAPFHPSSFILHPFLSPPVKVEVINTGTELLLGNVTNTHLPFLGQELFPLGLRVERQVCVPDGPAIRDALLESFARAEIVLVTGGLGPTSDDITRDLAAEFLNRPLAEDPAILSGLRDYFQKIDRPFQPSIARQAQVPAGAQVLPNNHGTAPGLYLPPGPVMGHDGLRSPHLFLLPGPPRELRPMFTESVVPILQKLPTDDGGPRPFCRVYRTVGVGESQVEAAVGLALAELRGLEVGYCARLGEVDLRLIGTPDLLERAEAIVIPALGESLLSRDGKTLEQVLVQRLREAGRTLAVAESCTGGLLANRITNAPGASAVFVAGFVTYAYRAKHGLLGVDPALIERGGAVSEAVAAAMAAGARREAGTDYALSTTGEDPGEGPDSGEGQPVGTLFIALAGPDGDREPVVERHFFPTDRETFKWRATQAALDLLRRRQIPMEIGSATRPGAMVIH